MSERIQPVRRTSPSPRIAHRGAAGGKDLDARFTGFAQKMRKAHQPAVVMRAFRHYYTQLVEGATGYITSKEAQPVNTLPTVEALATYRDAGQAALDRTAVIKLNGGLGTTMGRNRWCRSKGNLPFWILLFINCSICAANITFACRLS